MINIYLLRSIFVVLILLLVRVEDLHAVFKVVRLEVDSTTGHFSGRISRVNFKASLIRIKVDFLNIKYLNKKDRVEFWQEQNSKLRCYGFVIGKSSDYILMKIPSITSCGNYLNLANGYYTRFYSKDLANNILMGKELIQILSKKHLALSGILGVKQRELDRHVEKVHTVNDRYQLIRDELEAEWRKEISSLEEDRIITLGEFTRTQTDLDELNHKMEKYKISDDNLEIDRWSLDPRFYFKK